MRDVSFDLLPGEVHVLGGENGAGKSTLIKILGGVHTDYDGEVEIAGKRVRLTSPQDAAAHGISVIHQELSQVGTLSVFENMYLGREKTRFGMLLRGQEVRNCREILKRFDVSASPHDTLDELPIGIQQMIEIAKAIALNARIFIMDEPTSALTAPEVEKLFALIADLKSRGCGIIYISHKMDEIYRIADRITVLRDGKYIGTAAANELPVAKMVEWMIGRELDAQFPQSDAPAGSVHLEVKDLTVKDATRKVLVRGVSFSARSGEVLGFGGLQGSGNTELFNAIFGAPGLEAVGSVVVHGKEYTKRSPRRSLRNKMALLTNDRKGTGLVLCAPIRQNISLSSLPALSPGGWISGKREAAAANRQMQGMRVKAESADQEVQYLSGGNQQKVVLGKWLETQPRLLMLDEPTRGVDIGAKHEIYDLILKLKEQGVCILLITSEMQELLSLSDRIIVMHRGCITGEFTRQNATQELVLAAAMGAGARSPDCIVV